MSKQNLAGRLCSTPKYTHIFPHLPFKKFHEKYFVNHYLLLIYILKSVAHFVLRLLRQYIFDNTKCARLFISLLCKGNQK
jgi:hypothetical protein